MRKCFKGNEAVPRDFKRLSKECQRNVQQWQTMSINDKVCYKLIKNDKWWITLHYLGKKMNGNEQKWQVMTRYWN